MQRTILHQRKKARPAAVCLGARTDRFWARNPDPNDDRTNLDLLNAIEWMHARRGAKFSQTDARTISTLENRTWSFAEVSALHMRSLPSWLAEALPSRRGAAYGWFLGAVLGAYRAGAVGMLISYGEAMAALGIGSESTFRRWVHEMEMLGLIRTVQTWREDPSDARPRVYGRTLYVAGRVITDAIASLEGATDRGVQDREARSDAIERRKCAREDAKKRLSGVRDRRAPHDSPHLRPRPSLKKSATTPLEPSHNRNALPSFVGGDTTPPAVGDQQCATDASASVAISSGESLGDSRPTSTMLSDLLAKLGVGRSRQARALLDSQTGLASRDGQKASGEPSCGQSADEGRGGIERPPTEIPLCGPIASELWAMFESRRRTH
jgi:hypothetical protein